MINEPVELTLKAQKTRRHILDTALSLFVTQGYDATTMREIAIAADCSLGLTYRYFARKEELVLAVYWQMASETGVQIEKLPSISVAERFYKLMIIRLDQATQYREAFRALFAAAMNPESGVNILGTSAATMRDQVRSDFTRLVSEASDSPSSDITADVTTLLYSLHFGVILFWLYDRNSEPRTTHELLLFIRDMLKVARPALRLPGVRQAIGRLAAIIERSFFGEW